LSKKPSISPAALEGVQRRNVLRRNERIRQYAVAVQTASKNLKEDTY
jgi:hypothetical protein